MTDHDIHGCGRAGAAMGVLCAFFGAVIAGMIMLALGFMDASNIPRLTPPIVVGLVALFVGAGFFGMKAGNFLCEKRNNTAMNVLIGIALAYGSIAMAVGAGSLWAILISGVEAGNVVFILYFIVIFTAALGAIPATLLGVLYGFLMRNELRKVR